MVNVWIVWMRMFKSLVSVRMSVRLATWIIRRMRMLVMLVVRMFMFVRHWLVNVSMLVNFRYVQPNTDSHKRSGNT